MEENVFHHDQRGIHDNAEIDGSERNQIRRLPNQDHHRKGKEQRKRDGQGHNQGRAQMPQEYEQDDKDQDHAADENVRDGLYRRMNQGRAIVEGFDLDAGRQLPGVEVLNLSSNLLKDIERLVSSLEQNDAFDDIVAVIDADLPQSNPRPHCDIPQSPDEYRCPVFFRHHHVFDIGDPVDEAQSTNVVVLRADGQIAASDIGIAIGQGGHDLRQIDAVADQSSRIDIDVIFFGRPPERGHVDDTGNASELSPDLPVLNRFQIRERGLAGPRKFIPIDFGNRPPGRQRRRRPGRAIVPSPADSTLPDGREISPCRNQNRS